MLTDKQQLSVDSRLLSIVKSNLDALTLGIIANYPDLILLVTNTFRFYAIKNPTNL